MGRKFETQSEGAGVVSHCLSWIARACADRGLAVADLGTGLGQRWLRISNGDKAATPRDELRDQNGSPPRIKCGAPAASRQRPRSTPGARVSGTARPEGGSSIQPLWRPYGAMSTTRSLVDVPAVLAPFCLYR